MVLTSTPNAGEQNSSRPQLVVNTSAFKGEDLRNFILSSEEIERLRKQTRRSHPSSKPTLTREEVFECSTLDDDAFLTALEHQNSYVAPTASSKLDLSQSIENLMRYFDEEINVDDTSGRATPTKLAAVGKVASALATFKSKTLSPTPSPQSKPHFKPEVRASNIKELKQKYESSAAQVPAYHKQATPPTTQPRTVAHIMPSVTTAAPSTPKRKSKVKQMAQMFNAKISQFIRREGDPRSYMPLYNEFSPEPKPAPLPLRTRRMTKPVLERAAPDLQTSTTAAKPVPKPRVKPPTYRTGGGVPSPVPSPRPKRKQYPAVTAVNNCLVAEDVFSKLSVKDKALLYQKFIEDMSKQNPKFGKHAQVMAAQVQQGLAARGEVITEKQETVKHLAQELEAKFTFPKHHINSAVLQHETMDGTYTLPRHATTDTSPQENKSKEAEDILSVAHESYVDMHDDEEHESLHVSSLTVVLKPSPTGKQPMPKIRALPRKCRELRLLNAPGIIEPCQKRNNQAIRSSLPIEAYAPPKKIRRTRAERLAPKMFFQNQHMERLFYSWLKEKNGIAFDIACTDDTLQTIEIAPDKEQESALNSLDSETRKMAVERLLEEAIAKLDHVQIAGVGKRKEANSVEEKEVDTAVNMIQELVIEQETAPQSVVELELFVPAARNQHLQPPVCTPRKKRHAPAPPAVTVEAHITTTASAQQQHIASGSSATSSTKHSADESESGLSSMPKITSDESQYEQHGKPVANPQQLVEFIKPVKPPRKKKMRRTLTWKKENSIIECKAATNGASATTTDSDSDYKLNGATKKSTTPPQSKPRRSHNPLKKLLCRHYMLHAPKTAAAATQPDTDISGLDKTRLRDINSPRKIKNAYTLTVMSSPSPHTESDYCEAETLRPTPCRQASRSWPSVLTAVQQQLDAQLQEKAASAEIPGNTKPQDAAPLQQQQRAMIDSFIDQGFETGSNEIESSLRLPPPSPSAANSADSARSVSPLFIKLTPAQIERPKSRRSSTSSLNRSHEMPSSFSTPVKTHMHQSFTNQGADTHKQLFSPIPTPLRSRRRSFYDVEPRRSSLTMQVIREDLPLDHHSESPRSPCSPYNHSANESAFFANAPTLDMSGANMTDLAAEKSSSYWVTAGDFTISVEIFHNSPDRLRLLYDIFSQKSCETHDLHFGIDDHKFSVHNPADTEDISERLPKVKGCSHYWFSTGDLAVPFSGKYMPGDKIKRFFRFISGSMAANTSLRFGVDNFEFSSMPDCWHNSPKLSMESSYSMLVGLQAGNSNGLEGRSKYAWPNSMCASMNSNVMKTSDLDHSEFDSEELENSDFGRLSFSPFGSNNFDMGSGDAMLSPDMFSLKYENEPLDQLFEDARKYNLNKSQMEKLAGEHMLTVPEMLETLQTQKIKLKSVEERIRSYANPGNMASDDLEKFKDSSEYMRKLRNIISAIDSIGRDNGFKACSLEQLESFMFFLSRYADICLDNCNDHMDRILDALMDRRAVKV